MTSHADRCPSPAGEKENRDEKGTSLEAIRAEHHLHLRLRLIGKREYDEHLLEHRVVQHSMAAARLIWSSRCGTDLES
jgi:hypothetical protein